MIPEGICSTKVDTRRRWPVLAVATTLDQCRAAVDHERSGAELAAIVAALKKKGIEVSARGQARRSRSPAEQEPAPAVSRDGSVAT